MRLEFTCRAKDLVQNGHLRMICDVDEMLMFVRVDDGRGV
jgi:hypothetical protein